jgi:Zn-dependent protease with chaperone function
MDFFQRQRLVRRMSVRLVILFATAVVGIVVVVDFAAVLAFDGLSMAPLDLVALLGLVTGATVVSIGGAALLRTLGLRRAGGGRVARDLGGVPVPPDTTDPQLRRLRNVVEEMAIASGAPVPAVYLLPDEAGINAFAAGWSTSDAAVAVTRGALERLNRDELQGVIAHEFSHVVNGDMRLNIRLIGLLFGLLFLAVAGRTLLRFGLASGGRRRDRSANPLPLIGIALVVAGYVGVLAGRLIQAAVSRQREYLADASAVQYTRQTAGIAGALKKIGGLPDGSKLDSAKREEVGHMLFGTGNRVVSWFATHPPLADRIRVLDPSFDQAQLDTLARQWAAAPPDGLREDATLGLGGTAQPLPDPGSTVAATAKQVLASVGTPTEVAHRYAESVVADIPDEVLASLRDPATAPATVLGLLLTGDPPARGHQHALLAQRHGSTLADAAVREADRLAALHPLSRLPVAQLALPALRQQSEPQRTVFADAVTTLVQADNRITVFEYCLSRLLLADLTPPVHGRGRLAPPWAIGPAVATLLATLAHAGNPDPAAAERAFDAGIQRLLPGERVPYAPTPAGPLALEPGWPVLDGLSLPAKERLVAATVDVIGHDRRMTVVEAELLRTICALLRCPLPPLIGVA